MYNQHIGYVECSVNGIDFNTVGIKKRLASEGIIWYSLQDGIPPASSLFYRLLSLGFDGSYKYSEKIKVEKMKYKNRFLIRDKDCYIPVIVEDIAYFFSEDKVTFCITRQNNKYIINNYSLESLEKTLNPKDFFRINRQFIISFKSIVKIQQQYNYKLKIILSPAYGNEIIVSKNLISHFKKWANQ